MSPNLDLQPEYCVFKQNCQNCVQESDQSCFPYGLLNGVSYSITVFLFGTAYFLLSQKAVFEVQDHNVKKDVTCLRTCVTLLTEESN
jgi:hypothetical protein